MTSAAALSALTLLLAAEEPAQTTVAAPAPAIASVRPETALPGDPVSALEALPGVIVVRDGAPLAPARVTVRGLGGARLKAELGMLSLTDPADGAFDAEGLPWAGLALISADPTGRVLRLTPDRRSSGVRARTLVGALSTARVGVAAATPVSDGGALIALDAGQTRGDFAFVERGTSGAGQPVELVRDNNDQRRAAALVLASAARGPIGVEAVATGNVHEGGVPGFAAHPTEGLRRFDLVGAAGVRLTTTSDALRTFASAALMGAQHASTATLRPVPDTIASVRAQAEIGGALDGTDAGVELALRSERAEAATGRLVRTVGGARSGGHVRLPLDVMVFLSCDAQLVSDAGPLFSGRAQASRPLFDDGRAALALSLTLSRDARAPTVDELYAPQGFVLGNPSLRPEAFSDVEAATTARLGQTTIGPALSVTAAAFAGRIDDAILYLNRNAFEISPENTGAAVRAGADLRIDAAPHRLLGVRTTAGVLWSRLDVSGAPLPMAPPFIAVTAVRLGRIDAAQVLAQLTSRAGATTNVFGTAPVPGYALVDLSARLPFGEHLAGTLTIKNAFDQLDARDQNGLPLPGRLWFAGLEVRS